MNKFYDKRNRQSCYNWNWANGETCGNEIKKNGGEIEILGFSLVGKYWHYAIFHLDDHEK